MTQCGVRQKARLTETATFRGFSEKLLSHKQLKIVSVLRTGQRLSSRGAQNWLESNQPPPSRIGCSKRPRSWTTSMSASLHSFRRRRKQSRLALYCDVARHSKSFHKLRSFPKFTVYLLLDSNVISFELFLMYRTLVQK